MSNKIDLISIDTTYFQNVKEYQNMIEIIKQICIKENILIGIIVELRGRKINVVNIKQPIKLKKGSLINISYNVKKPLQILCYSY